MFGIGMVLAGGCASRSLVRFGSGSMKSLTVLLLMALSGSVVETGVLFSAAAWLSGLSQLPVGGHQAPLLGLVIGVSIAAACIFFQKRRREYQELGLGLALGALCIAAWWVSAWILALEPPSSLNFAGPTSELVRFFQYSDNRSPEFAAFIVLGTLAGAFLSALFTGDFKMETFSESGDMLRHLSGGILMGIGGSLAWGCTFRARGKRALDIFDRFAGCRDRNGCWMPLGTIASRGAAYIEEFWPLTCIGT